MSFECDNCGKNSVDQPGKWCSECQEREYYAQLENEGLWFSQSRLCQRCIYAWGPGSTDTCEIYNMPLYMVARKNKCKYFKQDEGVF